MVIPKFKVSDFDKYKGTTCSKNHLKMYCRKMGAYAKDEELLIHFFQESLTGVAVTCTSAILIWLRIGCNYRTCAKRGMNLSNNTPKGGET